MLFFLILGLALGAITVVFALQNISIVNVVFFNWHLHGSLSLVLLLAAASGVLVCVLLSIPEVIKTHIEFSLLRKHIKKLEDDNASYKRIVGDVASATERKVTETRTITTE